MAEGGHKQKSIPDAVWIIAALLVVLVAWVLLINLIPEKGDNPVNTTNSIFSALAFAGVIVAIYLQRNELILQREELESTRGEFEIQNQTLKKQRFENTFFNLLNLHHEIASGIYLFDSGVEYRGRAVFKQAYLTFCTDYQKECSASPLPLSKLEDVQPYRSQISKVYGEIYKRYEEHLSHYLKNFITLFRWVKQSDLISSDERLEYYGIIKSQLNSYELLLLFYHLNVGIGSSDGGLFNDLLLGADMNSTLLPAIKHSFIFDPDYVVKAALSIKVN